MPAGGFLDNTLLSLVRERYPEASPLHRLGRGTSGLVLFARNTAAASALARAWRDRDVKKTYRALGRGTAREERFVIDAPIGPVPHPSIGTRAGGMRRTASPRTAWPRCSSDGGNRRYSSVEIATGRPHQIRIHLAYAGHPLVGDPLYEAGGGVKPHPGLPGDGGYFLHAERLEFAHPASRQAGERSPPLRRQSCGRVRS